ncbi:MAG: ergothioneine biosynthesis protein EgtB [Chromatiales bacterium]|nr:ergothioneine biosynthesis protein EgtB [Chromatiales bacterium]
MASPAPSSAGVLPANTLAGRYQAVRSRTLALCSGLHPEDFVVQSMPSASPAKWHLAHTTWFFERFVLLARVPGYAFMRPEYDYLFNSYYESVGRMHPRTARGLLSRPSVCEVLDYRSHVDDRMARLLEDPCDELSTLVELGINHEEQHQELLLTDIKHLFSCNPLEPALVDRRARRHDRSLPAAGWIEGTAGIREIGHAGAGFSFDNETPRHRVLVEAHALAERPVTNAEFLEFIRDGGYANASLWLADGWAWVREHGIHGPLYWDDAQETTFTLAGRVALDPGAPVCHLSFYEADAFARWAGARLPTEAEWELMAESLPVTGNLLGHGSWQPEPPADEDLPAQVFGDTWEWTASPYRPYPGFRPLAGSLGEYNGKFMSSQMVCRGGSCVTPDSHVRASYRNFFYPHERWQFFGLRLARDSR